VLVRAGLEIYRSLQLVEGLPKTNLFKRLDFEARAVTNTRCGDRLPLQLESLGQ
jgi:hypothetical protein